MAAQPTTSPRLTPPQRGGLHFPYFISASTAAGLLKQTAGLGLGVCECDVQGYTSADLREVGGSSLLLALSMAVQPGAYVVVVAGAPGPERGTAAVGIASVSGRGSMELMIMAEPVFEGAHLAAMANDSLESLYPFGSKVDVRFLRFMRKFDPLAVGPWLRDSLCRLCDSIDTDAQKQPPINSRRKARL